MPVPDVLYTPEDTGAYAIIRCPNCEVVCMADEEQYRGEVSIDCTECEYHETHDLREVPLDEDVRPDASQ